MKNIFFFVVLFSINNNFTIQAQSDTLENLANYLFTDFKGKTYKISDLRGKYIYVMYVACEIITDTAQVRNYLRFYDKVAPKKPNWVFINIFWSNYDGSKSSIDENFVKWNKIIQSYNLKNESVVCLYENKSKRKIDFFNIRKLPKDIFWTTFYIDKKGKEVRNRLNDWGKDATEENIKEFKRMFLFNKHYPKSSK